MSCLIVSELEVNDIEQGLNPELKKKLASLVAMLEANPQLRIEVGVHSDCEKGMIQEKRISQKESQVHYRMGTESIVLALTGEKPRLWIRRPFGKMCL